MMAPSANRLDVRADPVIEVARRAIVLIALAGGTLISCISLLQMAAGERIGVLTFAIGAPIAVFAFVLRRLSSPSVVPLLASVAVLTIGAEVYAAVSGYTEYVAGTGTELVVFGLGVLATFVVRQHSRLVAAAFLTATLFAVTVSQLHLNGPSLEILTDVGALSLVMGTVLFMVTRVLDSLSESQTRFSDLASTIPVAALELDISRSIAVIERSGGSRSNAERPPETLAELMGLMRLSFANDMARQLTVGYGHWYSFATGVNAGGVQREMMGVLESLRHGRESGGGEITVTRLDGRKQGFIYRWTISRHPATGTPARLILAFTDVTQLRQAEAALERQLRERDQFVASVSHELRTPLTAILGLTEELVGRPDVFDAAEQQELLGIVHAETTDVVDIVEDLLVTARAEAGQLHINTAACDLAAEVARVAELMGGELLPGPSALLVNADPVRLRQVLRNLVSNAHRHGGPSVRMAVSIEDEEARLKIRDDGPPLSDAERIRIFEPYERAGADDVVGSVGLGLHVARVLARLMGGDLTYDHDGADSVFCLRLTLAGVIAGSGVD